MVKKTGTMIIRHETSELIGRGDTAKACCENLTIEEEREHEKYVWK